MAFIPFKLNAEFFKKNPGTIPLILVFMIAGFFTRSFVETSNDRNQDCLEARKQDATQYQNQIDYLRQLNDRKDSVITVLYQEVAIKNGVIERLPEKIDSLSRNRRK